jgi:arylsulfatase
MRAMGLLDMGWQFTPRGTIPRNHYSDANGWSNKQNPAWDSLPADRRADLARRMAIFAAAVEVMDRNIGRVVADLRANAEIENTLILVLSDNGACAEWDPWGFDGNSGPNNILHTGADLDRMGQPGSYLSYGSGWANACNSPFRLYKHYDHEGGISTPLIAHWPSGISRRGAYEHQMGHLIDLMPTCVELAGTAYPKEFQGRQILPMEGRSLLPAFQGKPVPREGLYWEHEGNRAVRFGKWKAVALLPEGQWELYDMERDRTEMHNLAAQYPERLKEMIHAWNAWAQRTHAIPWPWKPPYTAT